MNGDPAAVDEDRFVARRLAMVKNQLRGGGIRDEAILAAFARAPRHRFVPESFVERAYEDSALSIGGGQTISQPLMVALMTDALEVSEWRAARTGAVPRLLDVGTGSGYQAAILVELGAQVVTIERDAGLARAAQARLTALGYADRITCVIGDGSFGWPDAAPYDGIVVSAAAPRVPEPLRDELSDGARLAIPVGPRDHQELWVITRRGPRFEVHVREPCVFVPLIGRYGFSG